MRPPMETQPEIPAKASTDSLPESALTAEDLALQEWTVRRESVQAYCRSVLDRIGHCPLLGSPQWRRLPADDPRRLGAVFAAALAYEDIASTREWWAREQHRERLTAQREASHAISDAIDWGAQSRRPSHATLQRRRGVVA
jgi:Protein of unknown function (DUF2742)